MSGVRNVTITEKDSDMRLDRWFRTIAPEIRQGALQKLLRTGQIRVDGKRVKANHRLRTGETVRVPPLPDEDDGTKRQSGKDGGRRLSDADKELLPSLVIYRDEHVLVIAKPAGLAVQGGAGTKRHVDGLLDTLRFGHEERPRLVHRLDKDTSGLLALARDRKTARALTEAFRTRDVHKLYWAVTAATPRPPEGRIDGALYKTNTGKAGREKMVIDAARGDRAITDFRTIDSAGDRAAWVALQPQTGRTHQLRAHLAAIGAPILGDGKYGGQVAHPKIEGIQPLMHLHARRLVFRLAAGKQVDCVAPPPKHLLAAFKAFGLEDANKTADELMN